MSSQQSFYGLDEDIWRLFEGMPEPLAFASVAATLVPPPAPRPLAELWPCPRALLVPAGVPSHEITWRPLEGGRGRLLAEQSPVVELTGGDRIDGALSAGRIWLGCTGKTPNYREAKALFTLLRGRVAAWPRAAPTDYPVGPAAAAAVRAGGLRLVAGVQVQALVG